MRSSKEGKMMNVWGKLVEGGIVGLVAVRVG